MAVILDYEIADNWALYDSRFGKARKWWRCPRCHQESLFRFNGNPPWPPLDLECPSCEQVSPIPWPAPPMVAWTCQKCGHVQMVSRRTWESHDKKYTEVGFWGWAEEAKLFCEVCAGDVPGGYGSPATLGDAAKRIVLGPIAGALELVGVLTGWNETHYAKEHEEIEKATGAFDHFLIKVPEIRAEQARLAEEERQRAALEAKKRQEELRLLRKQARTAAGLKQMEPTNFELAVASLYLTLGYQVYVTPASRDQGIDLVAIKDKERIALQCKRYKSMVPVGQVRDFYGSFVGTYTRGIFVSTSTFSKATRDWAEERQGLDLIDGQQLAKLFVEHNPKIVRNVEKWKKRLPGKE